MQYSYAAELRGISKTYPGSISRANDDINIGLHRGEILCIAGENGAGKTTLMKILDGLEKPDTGEIFINGKPVTIDSPMAAGKLRIGMVHQHFMLFPGYTAAENIVMGMEPLRWGFFLDRKKIRAEAARVIEAHHFSIQPDSPVQSLSIGEMQQVEICRLLYRNADIIILDEPTSVLTEYETASLFETLRNLAAAGKSMFFITHKLHEIKSVAGRVAVLRRGKLAGICEKNDIDEYSISKMMMGSENAAGSLPRKHKKTNTAENGKNVIAFENVTVMKRGQKRPLLDDLSFRVRQGEIVGFTGVGGNGLGVLEAALGGFLHPASGKITHNGRDISRLNIRRLRNQGLAYVPADRRRVGSAQDATAAENLIIDRRGEFFRFGFIDCRAVRNFCEGLFRRYTITGADIDNHASEFSGGNLQKLILARETEQFRDYFIFSEPAWGLDIVSSAFIWKRIAALRDKGAAIVIISTNIEEILALADRIMVMYRGRAAAEFDACEFRDGGEKELISVREKIGNCMQGLLPVPLRAGGTVQK